MNYYPSSLPPPQQRGYSYKIKPNIIRTQMADGHGSLWRDQPDNAVTLLANEHVFVCRQILPQNTVYCGSVSKTTPSRSKSAALKILCSIRVQIWLQN